MISRFKSAPKPSTKIQAALDGVAPVSSLNSAERSALQLPVYLMAVMVLSIPSLQARRDKLSTLPPEIKPLVEAEARRVWELRRSNKNQPR